MEQRKMAVIFLGASMILMGVYALANYGGANIPAGETKDGTLFSDKGSVVAQQFEDIEEGWSDFLAWDTGVESSEDRHNVTKNIAQVAFNQMKALDQQGKSPFDQENINTPEVQASIESSINNSLDSFFANTKVTDKDIKISTTNTRTAKRAYIKSIEAILARNQIKDEYKNPQGGLPKMIETACTTGDTGVNKDIANIYAMTEKEFITVRVPSTWKEFHKQAIEHYRKGNRIFSAISNCVVDPINGFVAAQKMSEFSMNAATLQNLLKKMYTEVGL